MKRVLVLVDFFTQEDSLSVEQPAETAASMQGAVEIATRIRPFFSRAAALVATDTKTKSDDLRPRPCVGAERFDVRALDRLISFSAVVHSLHGRSAETAPETVAVDDESRKASGQLVEWLRAEQVSDIYWLAARPSPALVAAALACRSHVARTWSIIDTWTNESHERSARDQLLQAGVTPVRSAEVDAGCCV